MQSMGWGAVIICLVPAARGEAPPAPGLRIAVDAGAAVRTMRGGIGASWHAIEAPIPYAENRTEGGSAWGGHPPAEDEDAWRQILRHADWLGLDWCRVEIEQRMYEPARRRFDFDNPEMRILYRILDWCESRGADVFFQQMWGNVAWNAFPGWRDDRSRRVHSGPASLEDFAHGLATLMDHLIRRRGYTCIRWLSIVNEPGHGWSWWQRPPRTPMPLAPGLAAVRQALDAKGMTLPLAGPDWTDCPPLEPEKIDFDPWIGAYDIHTYHANFDGREGGYPMAVAQARLGAWARWAHARGKPFFLSELGTMVFGWRGSHPGPGSYESALKDAEMVVRGLGSGVDGFNRWSFINRGDLDGQWQLIDTWDRRAKKLLKTFPPHPNAYFLYGMLSRFTAKHSSVLRCEVEGGRLGAHRRVFAAALRSPAGHLTLMAVNDADFAPEARFTFRGLARPRTLYRYRMTPARRDRADVVLQADARFELGAGTATFEDRLPGSSVTVYTTYRRSHGEPGVIAERDAARVVPDSPVTPAPR